MKPVGDTKGTQPRDWLFQQSLNQAAFSLERHYQIPVFAIKISEVEEISEVDEIDVGEIDVLHQCKSFLLLDIINRLTCISGRQCVVQLGALEFAVIWQPVDCRDRAYAAAQLILELLQSPFQIQIDEEIREFQLTVSVGGSLYPQDGRTAELLLKHACRVAHALQEQGGNHYEFFSPVWFKKDAEINLFLESDLYQALGQKQLFLVYQPKVSLRTGVVVGAEVLLRWRHPHLGLIPPEVLISIAEATGLIVPISQWVLQTACEQFKAWQRMGIQLGEISINLSGHQLRDTKLHQVLYQTVVDAGLHPSQVQLELTETIAASNVELASDTLQALKTMQFEVAIDDFGKGYSSLTQLSQFAFTALKLDKAFIQDIHLNQKKEAIVKAIISMARALELKVVAEGVETPEEFAFVLQQGCDEMQGYFFSGACLPECFANLIRESRSLIDGRFSGKPHLDNQSHPFASNASA